MGENIELEPVWWMLNEPKVEGQVSSRDSSREHALTINLDKHAQRADRCLSASERVKRYVSRATLHILSDSRFKVPEHSISLAYEEKKGHRSQFVRPSS